MPLSLVHVYLALPTFLLVVARVAGLTVAAPFFTGAVIPMRIKALLVVAISMAVFPLVVGQMPASVTLGMAAVGMVGEIALGLVIGLGVSLVLLGVQLGIQLASQQAGMALGEVYNPMMEASTPVASQLYYYICMTIFLLIQGHHALVRAVLDSFDTIPLLGFQVTEGIVALLVDIFAISFAVAIRVAGPVILALLLSLVTLGFVSRTMPQLNILSVGFPIKILIALVIMALTVMSLEPLLLDSLTTVMEGLRMGLGLDAMRT